MWIIYSSEIAACIGENKYKKKWEAFLQIYQRLDCGVYYFETLNRLEKIGHKLISEQDQINEYLTNHTDISTSVKKLKTSQTDCSRDLEQNVHMFETDVKDKEIRIKEEQHDAKNKLEQKQNEIKHNKQIIDDLSYLKTNETSPMRQEHLTKLINEKVEFDAKIKKEIDIISTDLHNKTEDLRMLQNIKKRMISEKQTYFGSTREDNIIQNHLVGEVTDNNNRFYHQVLGEMEWKHGMKIKWGIGGKIDGFRNGKLIEIKNRKNRIFNPLPIYDLIQVQSYIQLLKVSHATVIQCITLEQGRIEKDEMDIGKDEVLWNRVLNDLQIFIRGLLEFVKSEKDQEQFLLLEESKKSAWLTRFLKKINTNM